MTDTEKKFKSAFMALLDDMECACLDIPRPKSDFCSNWCPFGDKCLVPSDEFEEDWEPLSKKSCAEAIFNWYMENSND